MTGWDNRGNGRYAWDDALRPGGVWDEYNGGPRTRAFGEALLGWLPAPVCEWLSEPGRTILDWGCAAGEITDLLRGRFPQATVAGLDFSVVGVWRARDAFGDPFIFADEIPGMWDAIVVSNVHEHFVDYLDLMRTHLAHTLGFYIILTPHNENLGPGETMTPQEREDAGHAHVHRFTSASFPDEIGGWRKVSEGIVVPGPLWPGEQLAIVYGREP